MSGPTHKTFMDPITHTCSGILLGEGLRPLTAVRKTTLVVAGLAGFAPDVDSISYLWGADAFYRVHHTYTHMHVGLVVVALLLAARKPLRQDPGLLSSDGGSICLAAGSICATTSSPFRRR